MWQKPRDRDAGSSPHSQHPSYAEPRGLLQEGTGCVRSAATCFATEALSPYPTTFKLNDSSALDPLASCAFAQPPLGRDCLTEYIYHVQLISATYWYVLINSLHLTRALYILSFS
jgi:hypothetical protein